MMYNWELTLKISKHGAWYNCVIVQKKQVIVRLSQNMKKYRN